MVNTIALHKVETHGTYGLVGQHKAQHKVQTHGTHGLVGQHKATKLKLVKVEFELVIAN